MTQPDITIYHNPSCGTSRNVLALIRHAGFEPRIVEYLKTPPSRDELRQLVVSTGGSVRAVLRQKGTPYAELEDGALPDGEPDAAGSYAAVEDEEGEEP